MKKIFKGFLFILIVLIILLASYAALLYYNIIQAPAFMPDLPFIQDKAIPANKTLSELEKTALENDILRKDLTSKEKEINLLKQDFQELENKQQAYKQADAEYKDKIIALNNKLNNPGQSTNNQESIYKDMAAYFMAMNSKDAADLMSLLEETDSIGILEKMEVDSAAEVLQKMSRTKAASITKKMLVSSPQAE